MRRPRPAITVTELDRLELLIRRMLESHNRLLRRVEAAEARVRELELALQNVSGGRIDPVSLEAEARTLQERNRKLEERLARARAVTQRMAGRLQFSAEDR